MGMIFQQFNLLMQKTALQNICFPMDITKVPKEQAKKRAMELLEIVGLTNKASGLSRPVKRRPEATRRHSPSLWPPIPRCFCAMKLPAP